MVLGITDPMRERVTYEHYVRWIERWAPGAELRFLSCTLGNAGEVDDCHGLIISGGGDVHLRFYPHADEAAGLVKDVNEQRDLFEFEAIRRALARRLPMLGICRGAQTFNVAMGGTLIADLEHAGYTNHRTGNVIDRFHRVTVKEGSLLHDVLGVTEGDANTFHHQAVDVPGRNLRITARSHDGVAEGLEWEHAEGLPFLLLVQWHPERMREVESPFGKNVMRRFAAAAREYALQQNIPSL